MNKKPLPLLVFVMLLAFTGQLLAAPLLGCQKPDEVAMDMHGEDCLSMNMAGGSKEVADVENPGNQEGLHDSSSDQTMSECHLCIHCPGNVPPRETSAGFLALVGRVPTAC